MILEGSTVACGDGLSFLSVIGVGLCKGILTYEGSGLLCAPSPPPCGRLGFVPGPGGCVLFVFFSVLFLLCGIAPGSDDND